MHKTGDYHYGTAPGVKLLEMPYGKGDVAMVIALPEAQDGLSRIEADLSYQTFATWRSSLGKSQGRVDVALPSFEFSYGGSVTGALKSMGIQRAFSDSAEFDKISKNGKLSISDVFHKAYVKVDESGTEAAAATGVVMTSKAVAIVQSVPFIVDHPFLFYLHDTKTGRILFIGQVVNPAAK
jgi:serpin B